MGLGNLGTPNLDPAPPSLLGDCEKPILLPNSELTQKQVENFWIHDRASLVTCAEEKEALELFYLKRDELVTGAENV